MANDTDQNKPVGFFESQTDTTPLPVETEVIARLSTINTELSFDLAILQITRPDEFAKQLAWFVAEVGSEPWTMDNPVFFEKITLFFRRIHPMAMDILSSPEGAVAIKNTISKERLDELVADLEAHKTALDKRVSVTIPKTSTAYIEELQRRLGEQISRETVKKLEQYITGEISAIILTEKTAPAVEAQISKLLHYAPINGPEKLIGARQEDVIVAARDALAKSGVIKEVAQRYAQITTIEQARIFAPADPMVARLAGELAAANPKQSFGENLLEAKKTVLLLREQSEHAATPTQGTPNLLRAFTELAKKEGTLTGGKQLVAALADVASTVFPGFRDELNKSFAHKILEQTQEVLVKTGTDIATSEIFKTIELSNRQHATGGGGGGSSIVSGFSKITADAFVAVFGPQITEVSVVYARAAVATIRYPLAFGSLSPVHQWGSIGGLFHTIETTHQIQDLFSFLRGFVPQTTKELATVGAVKIGQAAAVDIVTGAVAGAAAGGATKTVAQTGFRAFLGKLFSGAVGGAIGRALTAAGLGFFVGGPVGSAVGAVVGFVLGGPAIRLISKAGNWLMEKITTGGIISGAVGAAVSGFGSYVQNALNAPPPKKGWIDNPLVLILLAIGAVLFIGLMSPFTLLGPMLQVAHRNIPLAVGTGGNALEIQTTCNPATDPSCAPAFCDPATAGNGCGWPTLFGCVTQGPFDSAGQTHQSLNAIDVGFSSFGGTRVPIIATHDGDVVDVENGYANGVFVPGVYGNMIKIHGKKNNIDFYTLYAHLAQNTILVKIGDTVTKGKQIALSDDNGQSYGEHLHYGYYGGGNISEILPSPVPSCDYGKCPKICWDNR